MALRSNIIVLSKFLALGLCKLSAMQNCGFIAKLFCYQLISALCFVEADMICKVKILCFLKLYKELYFGL